MCVYVILLGVNRKRNLFTLAVYVNKPCRPILVYCEHPISLSTIPWPSSFSSPHCSPFLYPSLSSTYSPSLHPPPPPSPFQSSPTIQTLHPSTPSSQAPEAGASLGKVVWPTTAQWLWVIKVVQAPSPTVTGNCSWVIKALCHNYMDGQHHRPATLKQSASQLHGEEEPVCVCVCLSNCIECLRVCMHVCAKGVNTPL